MIRWISVGVAKLRQPKSTPTLDLAKQNSAKPTLVSIPDQPIMSNSLNS